MNIVVPDLGAARVTFGLWHVSAGDRVTEGDRVCEVLIPGAVIDLPAPASGVLVSRAAHPTDPLAENTMARPAFVSLDGLDGTGKSTQCRLLVEWLTAQKVPVTACTDPGGTALGQQLRQLLLFGREHNIATTTEAMLFMASRAQLVEEVIRPALARGEVVVSDRYLLANVVYQGHAGGLNAADLWTVGRFVTSGLEPDLTLVFDLPPDVAAARRNREADRMEGRGDEYFTQVRSGFNFEMGMRPDRYKRIDALPDVETVQRAVRAEVARLLNEHGWNVKV